MVGKRDLSVRGSGKGSMEKTVALVLVVLACGFLNPSRSRLAGGQRADKPHAGPAAGFNKEAILARAASLAVPFVRNAGRFVKEVRFSADLFDGRFFLTDKELVYSLVKHSGKKSAQPDRTGWSTLPAKNAAKKGIAFKEYFVNEKGSRIYFEPFGEEKGTTKISYFRGNDPAKWQSGLASYNSVYLGDIYPGIQVKLRASGKNIEKIFCASPGSNVARIRIGVAGVAGLKIADDGRLIFKNSLGELAMRAPVAWQEIAGRRRDVKIGYRLIGKHLYGFAVADDYDKNQSLVIDPELDTLLASTFLGGSNSEEGISLVLDKAGNVYLTGYTSSEDFPTTSGAYSRRLKGGSDVVISKLNGDLTVLLASAFLGGRRSEAGRSLTLDDAGNVYLTGNTTSRDFPTTPGAFDRTYNGYFHVIPSPTDDSAFYDNDIFVSKLDPNLATLSASTYLGGGDDEVGHSLALDGSGSVYLTGRTLSADFPTTPGAYDRKYGGIYYFAGDACVAKLNGNLTQLIASTFLGGSFRESGNSLCLDGAGEVYIAGYTDSKDFPATPGGYDRTLNDDSRDAFVSKMNSQLTELLAATYLGGHGYDYGESLALDSSGGVYLTGSTDSSDFPTTQGAYDRAYNGGSYSMGDVFVSRLDGNLATLPASTFLGGSNDDTGYSLALDDAGNVYLTGFTQSSDFPITSGAYDPTYNGYKDFYGDVFISKLNQHLAHLQASTFLGGSENDKGNSLALDRAGNVYLTGYTNSAHFPTTSMAYDRSSNDWGNAFVSKLNRNINLSSPLGGESWVAGTVNNITWESAGKITDVRIELSTDNGTTWSDVSVSPARDHKYTWTVPNTPSRECLVRISDNDHPDISDTSNAVFSILMNIDLLAERREIRAFSVVRQYGQIHFLVDSASQPTDRIPGMLRKQGGADALRKNIAVPETLGKVFLAHGASVQVDQYRIMRRQGNGDFALLKAIAPSELNNSQFRMQDKYLDKGTTYTYRVDAVDDAGQLIGISAEKTI